MSENQLPTKPETPSDISEKDLAVIQKFVDDGLPNIHLANEAVLHKAIELYMGGCTYWQISQHTRLPRPIILYLAKRGSWYAARQEYVRELDEHMKARVIDAKIVAQDFMLQLVQMFQKKIGTNLSRYMATGDERFAEEIDLKEIAQMHKTIELLMSLNGEKPSQGRNPAVGLNLGDGVTVERDGDNKITITPKDRSIGELLKHHANMAREAEKSGKERDINEDES